VILRLTSLAKFVRNSQATNKNASKENKQVNQIIQDMKQTVINKRAEINFDNLQLGTRNVCQKVYM
jgi:hypothetical protein